MQVGYNMSEAFSDAVLEALSQEFREKNLDANGLEELHLNIAGKTVTEADPLETWHVRKETNGQQGQIMILISLAYFRSPDRNNPWAQCLSGVGTNFIICEGCSRLVYA